MKKLFTPILILSLAHSVFSQEEKSVVNHPYSLNPLIAPFYHGIASGDPLTDRIILWTRVTPDSGTTGAISVDWKIATDTNITQIVNSGTASADATMDYTVKVDATGLQPGSVYYYRFTALGKNSVVGRTKTAPTGNIDSLRFAVVSCANFEAGYFNVYSAIKKGNDIDAVLFLGDYIYEYEHGGYGLNTTANRAWQPDSETISLADYRTRYNCYHLDEDLRRLHQQYPWIVIWDDHETANDSWIAGAQNHQPATEGDWFTRKDAGIEAHHEWTPIRLPNPADTHRIYRNLPYGNLVDLIMLDTRYEGRGPKVTGTNLFGYPVDDVNDTALNNPSRQIMSTTQFNWFVNRMDSSAAQWKIIGNQIMIGPLRYKPVPFPPTTYIVNLDQWDGFPVQRQRLFDSIMAKNIDNVAFITGDIHTSWANDLPYVTGTPYDSTTGAGSAAVEFVGTSVTSPGLPIPITTSLIKSNNPNVRYAELNKKGYVIIDVNKNRTQGDYYYIVTLDSANNTSNFETAWYVNDGERFLRQGSGASSPRPSLTSIPFAPDEPIYVGMKELVQKPAAMIFTVYPNPVKDYAIVQYYLEKSSSATMKIMDITGKIISNQQLGTVSEGLHIEILNTQNLSNGFYFLLLETPNGTAKQKLVKSGK